MEWDEFIRSSNALKHRPSMGYYVVALCEWLQHRRRQNSAGERYYDVQSYIQDIYGMTLMILL